MFKKLLSYLLLWWILLPQIYASSGELIGSGTTIIEENISQETDNDIELINTGSTKTIIRGEILVETNSGSTLENENKVEEEIDNNDIDKVQEDNSYNIELLTGSVNYSTGEVIISESSTGTIESLTGVTTEHSEIERFKIVFQNPSYLLDKDLEKDVYSCNNDKEECKVNFNIDDLELKGFSSKFYCKHDFSFVTGEEEKCNPGTIVFGGGEYEINFGIYKKENDDKIWGKTIVISNLEIKSSTGIIEDVIYQTGTIENIETSSGDLELDLDVYTGGVNIPEPVIEVQSGLDYSGSGNLYSCKKEECKINLTAESSFSGQLLEKDYSCLWSFSGGTFKNEDTLSKCNPGYVDYLTGTYEVGVKIYSKGDNSIYKERRMIINNILYEEKQLKLEDVLDEKSIVRFSGGGGGSSRRKIVFDKDIIVQSGLVGNKCSEERCRVNFKYDKGYKETCLWDFGKGNFKEKYLYTCNPGIVYYESGFHDISLEIFKDGKVLDTKNFSFENNYLVNKREINKKPSSIIRLQGKIASYKKLNGNVLTCSDVDKCSVNFTGEDSYDTDSKQLNYVWDFGNNDSFVGKNPKSVYYGSGDYKISLKVVDDLGEEDISFFYVKVIDDLSDLEEVDDNLFYSLQISGVMPNNSGKDDYEWIELKNIGEDKINLKGIHIDDIKKGGSKSYKVDYDLFLHPGSVKRFYKSKTNITLGNKKDEVNIYSGDKIIDSLKRELNVPDDFILTHDNVSKVLQEVEVIKVIDGDTIDILLNGEVERVRLIGVDTPETKHPHKPIEKFGIKSYEFTKSTLEGKKVFLELGDTYRGKYGRLLGYIYIDKNNSFNELLVQKGFARAYLKYPFKYSEVYSKLERQAKKAKLGIWNDKDLVKQINKWIELEKEYEKEEEVKELYSLKEIFVGGFNYSEVDKKLSNISKNVSKSLKSFEHRIVKKPKFLTNWQKDVKKSLVFDIKETEKELKSSVNYRVYKQKKGLKIKGNSKDYKKIILKFAGKDIELETDSNGDFFYFTNNLSVGNHSLVIYGVDSDVGNIYLKSGREVKITDSYVYEIKKKSIKKTKKSIIKNASASEVIVKQEIVSKTSEITKDNIPFILYLLLFNLMFLFIFLLLKKRKII